MQTAVQPNIAERRFPFTIDIHSGQSWARLGTGEYEYWTHFPHVRDWCPYPMTPPFNSLCVLFLQGGRHSGLHIGRVSLNSLQQVTWEFQENYSSQWSKTLSSNVAGWLLLPPD